MLRKHKVTKEMVKTFLQVIDKRVANANKKKTGAPNQLEPSL